MEIKSYLNDGACWQAQAALAYLRNMEETIIDASWSEDAGAYLGRIYVGRFENCREQGYVFSIKILNHPDKQGNWVVYEHRNVDYAVVFFFNGVTTNTPNLEQVCEKMGSKWNVTKDFGYDIMEMLNWLEKDMTKWVEDCMAD